MQSGSKKQFDVARLNADICAASVELLSAHCAADRVRLQYSLEDIVAFGERTVLKKALSSVNALHRFFSQIEAQLTAKEETKQ
jgi:hypothetical protein